MEQKILVIGDIVAHYHPLMFGHDAAAFQSEPYRRMIQNSVNMLLQKP